MPIIGITSSSKRKSEPVAGYKVWLDASDTTTITSSGGAVSQWTDKSANAYTFTQSTATNKPTTGTRTINSKNVIDFDGTNDYLVSSATASTWNFLHNATGATAFVVISQDTATSQCFFATSNGTSFIGAWFYTSATPELNSAIVNGTSNKFVALEYATDAPYSTNTTVALGQIFDASNATAANRIKQYKNNNTEVGVFQTGDQTYTSSNAASTLHIGAFPQPDTWFNGMMAEILLYDSKLSSGDIETNMNYLKSKWNI